MATTDGSVGSNKLAGLPCQDVVKCSDVLIERLLGCDVKCSGISDIVQSF